MSLRAVLQTVALTLVLLGGVGLGVFLSLEAWPATCSYALPHELSQRSRCLWIAWSADAYVKDQDLNRARGRVVLLGEELPDTLCALATGRCPTCRPDQATAGAELARALGIRCEE
ncbi:MAG: hypothetical protein HPY83_06040 [Anaerolineae bacterium]|nr:hypothetical protein [Anaerolineae bacterium]